MASEVKAPRPGFCKASVWNNFHSYQCQRKVCKDGWCKQHHPDEESARRAASSARYEAQWKERGENAIKSAVALLTHHGYTVIPPKGKP